MITCKYEEEKCPTSIAINILSGKWKLAVVWILFDKAVRFNELQRLLPGITQRVLTLQLRELEKSGILAREVYPEVPPKVEYSLTGLGRSIKPVLDSMCAWGKEYLKSENASSNKKSK